MQKPPCSCRRRGGTASRNQELNWFEPGWTNWRLEQRSALPKVSGFLLLRTSTMFYPAAGWHTFHAPGMHQAAPVRRDRRKREGTRLVDDLDGFWNS